MSEEFDFSGSMRRLLDRGGGRYESGGDSLADGSGNSCLDMCRTRMNYSGLAPLVSPFHTKCYDAVSFSPLNGLRVAFSSQEGTSDIDPAVPQMTPYENVSACLRRAFYINYILYIKYTNLFIMI